MSTASMQSEYDLSRVSKVAEREDVSKVGRNTNHRANVLQSADGRIWRSL